MRRQNETARGTPRKGASSAPRAATPLRRGAGRPGSGVAMSERSEAPPPFWRTKTLEEMSASEWESLCDGCARCCLVKLEEEDTGKIHFTDVSCTLLDTRSCRCADYTNRQARVHDCVKLTPAAVRTLSWLPVTCAYRVLAEGGDLAPWHPLVSGSAETVHEAGV